MRFSHFFIRRPIFAGVIAIIITIVGTFAYFGLPVSQFPDVVPPTVTVSTSYPGASAETVADTVAAPIEQQINGVDNMLYQSSQSTGDGRVTITVTFRLGTDLDTAQVLVQNRVALAEPSLPEEVRRQGVVVRKTSPSFLMAVNILSPDNSLDRGYVSNYALTQLKDRLTRVDGVGDVQLFGARDYAMRVWIDPGRASALNLTAGDIVSALRAQNVQVAAGTIGQPPFDSAGRTGGAAQQLSVEAQGRFKTADEFANIIVRTDPAGAIVRVRDVARVELGAEDYGVNAYLSGRDSIILGVLQRPGSNALAAAQGVRAQLEEAAKSFPKGLEYRIIWNPTEFISESMSAVQETLVEAMLLVVLVIIVFLQSWRAAIIPIVAIPVSLIGTFAMLATLGYSLNTLSMFGLVLAIGIVVDDAIVVVENVERNMEDGLAPREAAHRSMDEVSAALVAIVLVLCAVFVPTTFLTGITGEFYRQFAVTIATATVISLLLSLTLSPALAALLLKPKAHAAPAGGWRRHAWHAGERFNREFDRLSQWYAGVAHRVAAAPRRALATYGGLIVATAALFWATPTGFVPAQDQGYALAVVQLPPGSSIEQTDATLKKAVARLLKVPGTEAGVMFAGFDGASQTQASNTAAAYITFKPFAERAGTDRTEANIENEMRAALADMNEAFAFVIPPPVIQGIGNGGGYRMIVQDRQAQGYQALEQAAQALIGDAHRQPELANVFTLFNTATPRIYADIDRAKADMMGVPPARVFEALQVYLGSAYVNDFNLLGRTFRVTAQADAAARDDASDIALLKTRSNAGAMVPIGAIATFSDRTGPYRVTRYNLFPAVEVDGETAPGTSTGQALATMEALSAKLPAGFAGVWTDMAFQQKAAGNVAALIFALSVVFVFLVLAAQFESLILPLAIILIVPMTLLAAMVGVNIRGMDNNILTQIGLIVLIALAAKNAILIVEFAKQAEDRGAGPLVAAVEAARTRLRPILMTSLAFILGVVPLVTASGPVSNCARRSGLRSSSAWSGSRSSAWSSCPPSTSPAARSAIGWGVIVPGWPAHSRSRPNDRSMTMIRTLMAAVSALTLAACATGPDYVAPRPPSASGGPFVAATMPAVDPLAPVSGEWWHLYADPVLDGLVADALSANTDLRQAVARLEKARASLRETKTGRLPNVGVGGSTQYGRLPQAQRQATGGDREAWQVDVGADLSYELDLFGRVGRGVEAARGDVGAAEADMQAVRVMVVAETARAYADAAAAAERIAVAERIVALLDRSLKVTTRRQEVGLTTRLDTARIAAFRNQRQAEVPVLAADRDAALFRLAALTGRPPAALPAVAGARTATLRLATPIPVGDGAALLARRPDVRAAERRLAARDRTDRRRHRRPLSAHLARRIGGFGRAGVRRRIWCQSADLAAGSAHQLVVHRSCACPRAGRGAEADSRAALAAFDGAVLTALRETETALSGYARALDRRTALKAARDAAETAVRIVRAQQREGQVDSLALLDAERTFADTEADLASTDAQIATAQIALFRALGGGW